LQLRAAEERINQLEVEIEFFRDRAARAEGWLQTIQEEIEEKLIAPRLMAATTVAFVALMTILAHVLR
jgi:hypothetical protein